MSLFATRQTNAAPRGAANGNMSYQRSTVSVLPDGRELTSGRRTQMAGSPLRTGGTVYFNGASATIENSDYPRLASGAAHYFEIVERLLDKRPDVDLKQAWIKLSPGLRARIGNFTPSPTKSTHGIRLVFQGDGDLPQAAGSIVEGMEDLVEISPTFAVGPLVKAALLDEIAKAQVLAQAAIAAPTSSEFDDAEA